MRTINDIDSLLDLVSRERVYTAAGASSNSLTEAKRSGKLPASWYPGIRDLLAEFSAAPSDSLFNFKTPAKKSEAV